MFDTMTLTKIGAAACGALLFFLLGSWAAESLYATHAGGHGDDDHAATGYVLAAADDGHSEEAATEEAVPFAELLASADVGKGEKVWSKCKACHKLDGTDGTGPHLDGVVGRAIGGVDGFGYSEVLATMGGNWGPDELNAWLEAPKKFAPGNKMSFAGLRKEGDRANLIAYLQTFGG